MSKIFKILTVTFGSLLLLSGCTDNSTNTFPGDAITNANLSKFDDPAYEMYHPNYYVEASENMYKTLYANSEVNTAGGNNNIGLNFEASTEKGTKPSEEECKTLAEKQAKALSGESKDEKVIDEGGMTGCAFKVTAVAYENTIFVDYRVLVKKNTENVTNYTLSAMYVDSIKDTEFKDLQDSMSKFKLK